MAIVGNIFFGISLLGLLLISIFSFIKNKNIKRLAFYIIVLVVCAAIYFLYFQPATELAQRGSQSNTLIFIIILYVFMLLGMVCHYFYNFFTKPKKTRPPFDFGLFIAPFFASPIIFIPLLSAFQNTDIDLAKLTLPKFMVFVVAFENGFFWKEIFENRRKEKQNEQ
jgi:hypothetical protein